MRVRRLFVDGKHGQIHVRVARSRDVSGAPLLCLHMSPKSSRSFHRLMTVMGERRMLVAHDYPGYGESEPPPAEPWVSIADYAESAWNVCEALGLEGVHLLGCHTGSLVAAEMALQRPEQVKRIIMISAPIATSSELARLNAYFAPIPLDEAGTRFQTMWSRILEHQGPDVSLELMAESLAENLRGGEAYEWGHRAAFTYMEAQFAEALSELSQPVMILNPGDDLWQHTRRAYRLMPDAEIVEREDWGHGFLDVQTIEAAELFEQFLKK